MKEKPKVPRKKKGKYQFHLPKGQYLRKYAQYDDQFPAVTYDILSNGGCVEDVQAVLRLCKGTYYKWLESHEEFRNAIHAGQYASKQWHREYMTRNMDNRNYNEKAHGRLLRMAWNIPEDSYVSLPELAKAQTA